MARLEWIYQDEVAVDVVGKHGEVVPAAGADGKAAHVFCVEFGDRFDVHGELVYFDGGWRGGVRTGLAASA